MPGRTAAAIVASLPPVAGALLLVCTGCATAHVEPSFYQTQSFALASVHARRAILVDTPGALWTNADNELGAEVIEMSLEDIEVDVAQLLGVTELTPLARAAQARSYDALPEALPPEDWSQVKRIIAVDIDAPGAAPALGALARELSVEAVVVVRHEWSVARDRMEISDGLTAFDRCSLLVVDRDGRRLVDDVVVARVPVLLLWGEQARVGINGAGFGDESRELARRTARDCMVQFKRHLAEARPRPQR